MRLSCCVLAKMCKYLLRYFLLFYIGYREYNKIENYMLIFNTVCELTVVQKSPKNVKITTHKNLLKI